MERVIGELRMCAHEWAAWLRTAPQEEQAAVYLLLFWLACLGFARGCGAL